MISNSDQYTASNKAFFASQLATLHELTSIAIQGIERVVVLNLAVAKASAYEATLAVKELLAVKDPQTFLALASSFCKPGVEHVAAYSQHLTTIASTTKEKLTKMVEEQADEARSNAADFVNIIAKTAPAGYESAIPLLKSSVANPDGS